MDGHHNKFNNDIRTRMMNNLKLCETFEKVNVGSVNIRMSKLANKLLLSIYDCEHGRQMDDELIRELSQLCQDIASDMEIASQALVLKNLTLLSQFFKQRGVREQKPSTTATAQVSRAIDHCGGEGADTVRSFEVPSISHSPSLTMNVHPQDIKEEPVDEVDLKPDIPMMCTTTTATDRGPTITENEPPVNIPMTSGGTDWDDGGGINDYDALDDVIGKRNVVRSLGGSGAKKAQKCKSVGSIMFQSTKASEVPDKYIKKVVKGRKGKLEKNLSWTWNEKSYEKGEKEDLPPMNIFTGLPVRRSAAVAMTKLSIKYEDKEEEEEDNPKYYTCGCGRYFARRNWLAKHSRSCSGKIKVNKVQFMDAFGVTTKLKCPHCKDLCPFNGLDDHIKKEHKSIQVRVFGCNSCNEWFHSMQKALQHSKGKACAMSVRSVEAAMKADGMKTMEEDSEDDLIEEMAASSSSDKSNQMAKADGDEDIIIIS